MRIREPSWATIGIALLCGALYFLGHYAWAFWVIVMGIALVVFKTVRAAAHPRSLLEKHMKEVFSTGLQASWNSSRPDDTESSLALSSVGEMPQPAEAPDRDPEAWPRAVAAWQTSERPGYSLTDTAR